MDEKKKDDIYYVCTMIEYVARATNNHRKDIVARLSKKSIEHQLKVAKVNHCLSFEQVSDEWIEQYDIPFGTNVYYSNPDYLKCSYEEGVLLT